MEHNKQPTKLILGLWVIGALFPLGALRYLSPEVRLVFDAIFGYEWIHVLLHPLLFAGLSFLLVWTTQSAWSPIELRPGKIFLVMMACLGIGVVQEGLQTLVQGLPTWHGFLVDLCLDLTGGVIGLGAWWAYQKRIRRKERQG